MSLKYGADINGLYEETLITAVQYGDCVRLLCDYGVDLQYNINNEVCDSAILCH